MRITRFQKKVYELVRRVPRGRVTTYSAIAKKLNTSPRAVGQALKKNPDTPRSPCHRVINNDGTIGGFKGRTKGKTIQEKTRFLRREGIIIKNNKIKEEFIQRQIDAAF